MSTNFFDLPAELRLYVYELALSEVLEQPETPWTQMPSSACYETFISLATTGHPLSTEVISLFNQKYSNSILFYFDDICRLYDFKDWVVSRQGLEDLRVCFRGLEYEAYEHDDGYGWFWESMLRHLCWQSGRPDSEFEGLWTTYRRTVGNIYRRSKSNELYPDDVPQGFRVRRREGSEGAAPYFAIAFPLSPHNLQLTVFLREHQVPNPWQGPVPHPWQGSVPRTWLEKLPAVELSGKLMDFPLTSIDIAGARAGRWHSRDSPWRRPPHPWRDESQSPDLDEEERDEMDADSWGVPDREESEDESNEEDEFISV